MRPSGGPRVKLIFIVANGLGPWPCYFCPELVYYDEEDNKLKFNVHHIDHNHDNDDPANLAASHHSCHGKYHRQHQDRTNITLTEEGRERIRAANLGKEVSAETRAKISKTLKERYAARK